MNQAHPTRIPLTPAQLNRRCLLAVLAAAPFAAACVARAAPDETHAQAELPKEHLVIVTRDGQQHPFDVEVAKTEDQQEIGLMFRPSVADNGGMLFVWPAPQPSQMWMKNTVAPLDMVFINADGSIRHIAENAVPQSLAVIDSHGPVRATLELQAGITRKLNIRVGDKVQGAPFTS